MPRRNLYWILFVAAISVACYRYADRNPYGRYFADVMNKIDQLYVEPVDQEKLFDAAVTGMLKKNLDEHSEFMGPIEMRDFTSLIDQRYGGVGIEVNIDNPAKKLTVMGTLVGSPAYEERILSGDEIVSIDGQPTAGLTTDKASDLIRGPVGTEVRLTLNRPGSDTPLTLTLKRAEIKVDSVRGDFRNADDSWNFRLANDPRFACIRIRSFGDQTAAEVRTALESLGERRSRRPDSRFAFQSGRAARRGGRRVQPIHSRG